MKRWCVGAVAIAVVLPAMSCGGRRRPDDVTVVVARAALTGPAQVTVTLPAGVNLGDVVVGAATTFLKLDERAQLITGSGPAVAASAGSGNTVLKAGARSRDVVSRPRTLVLGDAVLD